MLEDKVKSQVAGERKKWEAEMLDPARSKLRQSEFFSPSGLPLDSVYDPVSLEEDFDYLRDLGYPGCYPFTRGTSPTMYRGQLWNSAMYSGYGTAEESNLRYKYLLDQGQSGFSIALDLPTQLGYDPDHVLARGEVGQVGVVLSSFREVERLFDGIPLSKVRQISVVVNSNSVIVAAMIVAFCEKAGIDPNSFIISFQNDVLKEFVARGNYIFPPKPAVKLAGDLIEYTTKNIPRWLPICICGAHLRGAGGNAAHELGYCFANAMAQIEDVVSRGLKVEDFVPNFVALFTAGMNVMAEVAKFRAARRLWSRLMKERFGTEKPMPLRIHAYGQCIHLTAQQPLNNIARIAINNIIAVLGGVTGLSSPSHDEALSLPTEEAVRTSLRSQQIVAYETGLTDYVDPLAGSYALESLTNQLENKARELIVKVDEQGGAIAAIEKGYMQQQLSEGAYQMQKDIETGKKCMVGVNKFRLEGEKVTIPVFSVNEEAQQRAIDSVKQVRRERDNREVARTLAELERQARAGNNIMPAAVEASKAYATMQEMCDVLRDVYGAYRETASNAF